MPLFPPEILHHTTESHFTRTYSKTWAIYLFVLLFVTAALISLPFITVEVSTQARGIIRSEFDNNRLQMVVGGEVIDVRITENQLVTQGDTLLVLNSENITVQINRAQERIDENAAFIHDISALLAENFTAVRTPRYFAESNLFRATENGASLSGGQKQRLAIARALYKNPKILILDEATSSLDSESENFVQQTIQSLKEQGKTIIIIAHRLSTVVNADDIVVLENGKVIEQGNHEKLFNEKGRYWEMWKKQTLDIG